jgi:hypothetical protein
MLLSTAAEISVAIARWFTCACQLHPPPVAHDLSKLEARLTSSATGPDDGVASPMLFEGIPMLLWLNLKSVARPGARGVRRAEGERT